MKVTAVVPAYNEEETIGRVLGSLHGYVSEVVVVDDGSADATGMIAREKGAIVCRHVINRGQGAALKTGIDCALERGADIIVTFDADGQHCPEEIAELTGPVEGGRAEAALGSRFMKSEVPFARKFLLKAALVFTRVTSGLKVTDTHNGLRAFSREAAKKIRITQDGFAHASEILNEISRLKLRYEEVPTTLRYTEYSRKKGQGIGSFFRILFDLFKGALVK